MKNKKILAGSVLAAVCSVGFVAAAAAANGSIDSPYTLDDMVVTATATPNRASRATASISLV